ncbi:MAG: heavy metal sensor histidine kinase [Vicinamibacterales bacterium]
MIFSLRTRLALAYTAIFGLLLVFLAFASYQVLATQLDADATARLTQLTDGLHGFLHAEAGIPVVTFDPADADQAAFVRDATQYFQVFDASTGAQLVRSDALDRLGLQFTAAEIRAFHDRPRVHDIATDDRRLRISNSLFVPSGGRSYLVQVGVSLESVDRALDRVTTALLWTVPVGLLAAAVTGRWMAGLGLAPLVRLAAEARSIDLRRPGQRLSVQGTRDELDDVGRAFNETLERLEQKVGEMRQFSAALAHELRTPLTALRGEIELSLRGARSEAELERALESQLEEVDKLKRLIDHILTLARAEAGEILLAREPVNLSALAHSIAEQLEPVALARGIQLTCDAAAPAIVRGDQRWLERVLLNLLDNAIKFTSQGGAVSVSVHGDADNVVMVFTDNGRGIDAESLPHVFERFFRADPSRSSLVAGAGVGLSLVKWIVERHGGIVTVRSVDGAGAVFTVSLPTGSD